MRRYSQQYYSPPRRGYGGRERSPPRRGYGGGAGGGGAYGRRREQNQGSLLGKREPRGFAFVQFVDAFEAAEAQQRMNGKIFAGREISVVLAAETRKRPEEMRHKARLRGPSGYGGRSSYYGRSRSRSRSPMRSPHHPSGSRGRYRSRSYSPAPRRRGNYSASPGRRHEEHARSPRGPPRERDGDYNHNHRSYSPRYENAGRNGYGKKSAYEPDDPRAAWGPSPGRVRSSRSPGRYSRSPSGSRSRSADLYADIADK